MIKRERIEEARPIRTVPQIATRVQGEWWWLREGSIPLRFQAGVAAPINKSPRSLGAQTGWFVNSSKNKVRYTDIYKEATRPFTNHPVCAAEEWGLLLMAQPPLLENGGDWPLSQPTPFTFPRLATYRTILPTDGLILKATLQPDCAESG